MSQAMACSSCNSIMSFPDAALGEDARKLLRSFTNVTRALERTESIRKKDQILMDRLDKVFEECSSQNWNGEDAPAISQDAYIEALRFIKNLPTYVDFPLPEIVPDNDGEISFEWYKDTRDVFVVSISGKNRIAYAGIFGTNDIHGTEFWGESIPPIVLTNLQRLFS